ncbi:lysosomal alpha-glucosidase-like [Toxorhynchites rutilus septentrionalis]|uniref:lysosomal alpha-glucosidase-like n=1 Tax=Toxorhynchites rutilus septentrionalis TaxID=329112 RepID=UPI002479DCE0|nr:lysosomal alpha-glucosidase-like [Toxorhynchites rutilus septentrionalis]XP_055638249.1 lysosomal alpha-glucosidase-like [Toxorhynchites rutilus septentrionalis]XP_055638250.1 lysosomal alpha-glucosidase-like [Toxorhynchites rutilus septentrionalis]
MPPPLKHRERTLDIVEQEVDIPEFDKKPAFIHVLLLNKTLRLFIILGIATVVIPALAYLYFFSQEIFHEPKQAIVGTCGHPTLYHIQCGFANISQDQCHNLGCCYTSYTCYHSLPSEYQYRCESDWHNGVSLTPTRNLTPYDKDPLQKIQIHLNIVQQTRLQLTLVAVPQDTAQHQINAETINTVETDELEARIYSPTFFIEVQRKQNKEIIFSTARGPLIVTKDFFEWTLHLGVDILFGLGEAMLVPGKKYLLLNNQNVSAIPVVMGYNIKTNQFNGIIFSTPGLTEVEIVRSRLVIVRSQFTDQFQLEILSGPGPTDLHRQLKAITQNQYLPPFWSYGVHVCDQSRNTSLKTIRKEIESMLASGIILDSQCVNDDLFWLSNHMVVTNELAEILHFLANNGKRFIASVVMVLEPIANSIYNSAKSSGLLLRNAQTIVSYRGIVRNRTVVYVDWRTNRHELSTWLSKTWMNAANLNASGYSLCEGALRDDGNKTFPTRSQLTYLPENLNNSLNDLIRWDTKLSDSMEAAIKSQNKFGPEMVRAVQRETHRDTFITTGTYDIETKAAILAQNVSASWISLRNEVNRAIGLSLVGMNFIGTPICGNAGDNVTEELCIRWYQFGSLLPLFKVSADRMPNRFSKFAERIMQSAIRKRFALLEYFNSLIVTDSAYLRPMFYHYEEARNYTVELWEQFMVGDSLLVAPVLLPQMAQIDIYFPETFYELWSGEKLPTNDVLHYAVVESDLPLFVRPGYVVGLREISDEVTGVDQVRLQLMFLIGAFMCNARKTRCESTGRIVFAEGFNMSFAVRLEEELTIRIQVHVSSDKFYDMACSPTDRSLSAEISYVQLYGHPNNTETIAERIDFDMCRMDVGEYEKVYQFPNKHNINMSER